MVDEWPSGVPGTLTAGDTWQWKSRVPPVDGIALTVSLRPVAGGDRIEVPGRIEGGARVAVLTPDATRRVVPGRYRWAEVMTRASDGARWTGETGAVEVLPDPMESGGDLRPRAERILDAIDARIEGRANADCDAYTIEGRSISRTPLDVLLKVRGVYARQARAAKGGGGIEYRRIQF